MVGGEAPGQARARRPGCLVNHAQWTSIIDYREDNRKPLRVSSKVVTSSELHWKRTPFLSLQIAAGFPLNQTPLPLTGKGRGSQTLQGSVRLPQDQQPVPGATCSGDVDTLPFGLAPGRGASSASWQHTGRFRVWTPEPACLGSGPSTTTDQLGAHERAPALIHLPCIYSAPTMCPALFWGQRCLPPWSAQLSGRKSCVVRWKVTSPTGAR